MGWVWGPDYTTPVCIPSLLLERDEDLEHTEIPTVTTVVHCGTIKRVLIIPVLAGSVVAAGVAILAQVAKTATSRSLTLLQAAAGGVLQDQK